jgi:hypothetical protein
MLKLVDPDGLRKHSTITKLVTLTEIGGRYTVRVGKGKRPINFHVMLLNKMTCKEAQKVFYSENSFDFLGKCYEKSTQINHSNNPRDR